MNDQYELIIVGGGPGGLTAGLYGARANLKTLVLERYLPGGQLANTHLVDDYPGFESVGGPDLAAKMEAHAKNFGLEVHTANVTKVRCDGDDRIIETDDGEYRTKALVTQAYDRMVSAVGSGDVYATPLDPPPADESLQHEAPS